MKKQQVKRRSVQKQAVFNMCNKLGSVRGLVETLRKAEEVERYVASRVRHASLVFLEDVQNQLQEVLPDDVIISTRHEKLSAELYTEFRFMNSETADQLSGVLLRIYYHGGHIMVKTVKSYKPDSDGRPLKTSFDFTDADLGKALNKFCSEVRAIHGVWSRRYPK